MKLAGKVAVVTGGGSGIGRAIATRFAQEGARVCIGDVNRDNAASAAREIGNGAFSHVLDVTSQSSIDAMVSSVVSTAGEINILVNSAAVWGAGRIDEVTRGQWASLFQVNVEGTLFTMQAVARLMIDQGRGGKIINFSSQAGRRGDARTLTYAASKAAVISITQSAALHLIKHGINVNAIAPGVVETPLWDLVDPEFAKRQGRAPGETRRIAGESVPFGRMGKPEEIAGVAAFLASDDAAYVVAQTYGVDGGNWMA